MRISFKTLSLLILSVISLFYFLILPKYIQGGDTAELVNASFHLFVPHPPGYPLFLWMEHFWTHLLPFSTVFWRASLLSLIFGLGTLLLLIFPFKKSWPSLFLLLAVATQNEFIEASILPDVFSLHALLVALMGYTFFATPPGRRAFFFPFLFFLGTTHHHTVIFLIPALLQVGRESWKKRTLGLYFKGVLTGVSLSSLLYLSLFLCHPDHPFSWGGLKDIPSLFSHILRKDYGTFKLAGNGETGLGPFLFLLKSLTPYLPGILVLIFLTLKRKIREERSIVWLICILLTLWFPFLMNVSPVFLGAEILKRFHVMPLIMISVLASLTLQRFEYTKKEQGLLCLFFFIPFALNFSGLFVFKGFSEDSIIEDYSHNLYEAGKKYSPSLILADNDSSFFGVRYIQAFREPDLNSRVAVATAPLFFHPWFLEKIQKQVPEFKLGDQKVVQDTRSMDITQNIVRPNLEFMNFVVLKNYLGEDWYKVTFRKLGRVIQKGQGVQFEENDVAFKKVPELPSGPQEATRGYLYYQYAHYYLARAFFASRPDKVDEAVMNWEKAVEIVPYAWPAMNYLCKVDREKYPFCLDQTLNELNQKTKFFY